LISDQKECQHIMMGKIGKRNRWRAISQWNAYNPALQRKKARSGG
jgi:hypothetical protein